MGICVSLGSKLDHFVEPARHLVQSERLSIALNVTQDTTARLIVLVPLTNKFDSIGTFLEQMLTHIDIEVIKVLNRASKLVKTFN